MSPRFFTVCCLAVVLLAAPAADAGMISTPTPAPAVRLAAMGCAPGYYRDASGACIDYLDRSRVCPSGYFALSFPNGNGYRCVPTAWLNSRGWLGDLL
jgi:hypothetical protein